MAFFQTRSCPVIKEKPELNMGPIGGEINIAPMITGMLLVTRPHSAMRFANVKARK